MVFFFFLILKLYGLSTRPHSSQDVLFLSQDYNPGLPTPSLVVVQRQSMLLLGMLRAGWRLSENTGKPADFELWTLWVRHPLWDGEIALPKSPRGQRPRGPLAITSQGPLSGSPARSKGCSCLLLSGTAPSGARASNLPKGAKVHGLFPREPVWPDPTAGPEGRGGQDAV